MPASPLVGSVAAHMPAFGGATLLWADLSEEGQLPPPMPFSSDARRRHHHFIVTITYFDSGSFARVYTSLDKAQRFAERQKKSPVVKATRINKLS